jgi:predicted DNA binding CopG/RHH family protein
VQDIGEKEKRFMKKTIKYTDGEIDKIQIIEDFLPSPEELAFKEENTKITISLTKETVNFFKDEAKKHHTQYQKMIRNLLDLYVAKQMASITKHGSE